MGAELLLAVWTTTGDCDTERMRTAIEAMDKDVVLGIDAYEESAADVYERLLSAVDDYAMILDGSHRYGDLRAAGPDRFVAISGGASWGDDPYAGWSELCLLLDACGASEGLASAAGYIGGGVDCGRDS